MERIGLLTLEWAAMEFQLDYLLSLAFDINNPQSVGVKHLPHTFDRKISDLKTFYKKLPPFISYRDFGLALLKRTADLADLRHTLVHGIVQKHLITGDILITRVKVGPHAVTAKQDIIRARTIDSLILKIGNLRDEWGDHIAVMYPPLETLLMIVSRSKGEGGGQMARMTRRIDQIERSHRPVRPKGRSGRSRK